MSTKTRILYYGDSPSVSTGFGTVAKNILVPLYETNKYDITVLGVNYWGTPHPFPFPLWPVGHNSENDPYGRKQVQQQIANSEFDILLMIPDSFILDFVKDFIPQLKFNNKKFKSIIYFPIDGKPKESWVEAMAVADYPVTYTQFGFDECVRAHPPIKDKLQIIPHGINANDFYPLGYGEILDFKRRYFGPVSDKYIITCVNRNQQRKDIPRLLMAFKEFHKKHEDTVLYLHMAVRDQGWKLDEVVKSMGLRLNTDVIFPQNFNVNTGFPVSVLNQIYNASDVVVSSTTGEGWGLAQVESMATKTPIISPNNTACTNIVGEDRGLLVDSGHDLEHYVVLPNDNEVLRPIISVKGMVDALEKLYSNEALGMTLGENGYKWLHESLIWNKHITPQWESIIDEAADSLFSDADDEECYDGAVEV